jgi:tellurite resistance protein
MEIVSAENEYQVILTNTLRKIGRNLINYQLVERLWKMHLGIVDIKTELSPEPTTNKQSKKCRDNIPMGWLAVNHRKSLFTPIQDTETEDSLSQITIKTSFRIEDGDGVLNKNRREELSRLLKERNFLVHSLSEVFDSKSEESCLNISAKLDEENIKILKEIEFLNNISSTYQDCVRELLEHFESDAFINDLETLLSNRG